MIPLVLDDRERWLLRAAERPEQARQDDPSELMYEFCDDSDGMAEFDLAYCQSEDADYAWIAAVRWEGRLFPIGMEEPMAPTPVEAVWDAIRRFFDQYTETSR